MGGTRIARPAGIGRLGHTPPGGELCDGRGGRNKRIKRSRACASFYPGGYGFQRQGSDAVLLQLQDLTRFTEALRKAGLPK